MTDDASTSAAKPADRSTVRPDQHREIDWEELRVAARAMAERAYAPYSNFKVGAAGLTDDGRIVSGCNVENISYGLTLCAECGLVSALQASGGGRLIAVSIVSGSGQPCTPCGRCRQLLYEFGGPDCLIEGGPEIKTLGQLLPDGFGPQRLAEG